ncbi:leukotriene B4 receptor 1 [Chanos chanos]|uniref:Leukotriene B4 receptor 1 n=1 Tax=Chanos chanos TaxID=29144 RepID=A0A6J2URA3_CHACN|nr:leukotriene B4 receptor 1-like [Chanos chanos]
MHPEVPSGGNVVACVILALSFLVGAPGNFLVIWTIVRHVKPRSHTVVLILHLAVADLLVLITLPLWIYSMARYWVFGVVACKVMVYIINACMYSSVFLITLMSVERFVAVRYPFASLGWKKRNALKKVLLVVWVSAFLLSVPIIPTQTLGGDPGEEECLYREYQSRTQEAVCVLLETLIGFVLPFIILVVCYGCVFGRIAQMTFKTKRKSTGLIAAVVISFALCWIPYHIGNVLSLVALSIGHSDPEAEENLENARTTMTMISGALVFISSTINPILYVFAARSFRSSLRDTGIQRLFRHLSSSGPNDRTKELSYVSKKPSTQTEVSQCSVQSKEQTDLHLDVCDNASS